MAKSKVRSVFVQDRNEAGGPGISAGKPSAVKTVYMPPAPGVVPHLQLPKNFLSGNVSDAADSGTSYILGAQCNKSSCLVNETLTMHLQVLRKRDAVFILDPTADLTMYINGVEHSFTYQDPWRNGASVILFSAPSVAGAYVITFRTTLPIQTNTASVYVQVMAGALNDLYFVVSEFPGFSSSDITLLNITAMSRSTGSVVTSYGVNPTLRTVEITNITADMVGRAQTYTLTAPHPVGTTGTIYILEADPTITYSGGSVHLGLTPENGVANPWISFSLEATCEDFLGVSAELSFKDSNDLLLWSMPLVLPTPVGHTISMNIPFPTWDDSYELMLELLALGWMDGTFTLTWTLNGETRVPVTVNNFSVSEADASFQPVTFLDANNDDAPINPLFPIIWFGGVAWLAFWTDEPISVIV